jgi:Cellulase (glycosyl hydrolase family 5)
MQRLAALFVISTALCLAQTHRWSEAEANGWYAEQPWLVGSDYIPSTAINELEMWQTETFDPARIDTELGWAQSIGMNTMRVFLHDLLWQQDPAGFKSRIDAFLQIAAKHNIRPMFVLFDSCWDPLPKLGPQRAPRPGVHNSGWVQSPGAAALHDKRQYARLEAYVKGVVGAFAQDHRVLAWDLWNEPDNRNSGSYGKQDAHDKIKRVRDLLPKVFEWAREVGPTQPLTSGLWNDRPRKKFSRIEKIQTEQSDVISFHNYGNAASFRRAAAVYQSFGRPVLCTEFMARPRGSTFQNILPIAKELHIAAYNWGFVSGKTQTRLPWDSWRKPYVGREPDEWFHDVFYSDGRPYHPAEVEFLKQITGQSKAAAAP